ncbi:hypothetical protein AAM37_gp48 [Pantoea phage vB_PagM_AAM37]|uniref:Uncharacterized protein n=1 Tax=Pantoea phage vB_PagM_AAM37 TaxID=2588093 RepID=A0A513ZYD2_9CAUD|nr:hypothetical protein HWC22_gp48 [Pantoea phage vB_PagM_AAM37]QDH45719.1 hypothetical protein AAM37_gp48 [Pantoea phage vB_PagM_AAM37]
MTKCKKQQRRLVFTLVNTFGKRHEKMAYQSIVNNLVGLGRKVQSLTQQVRNRDEYISSLESQLAEARRVSLFGNPSQSCSVGVGDGTGNLVVHGNYESIKAVQRIILQAEQDRGRAEAAEAKLAELYMQEPVACGNEKGFAWYQNLEDGTTAKPVGEFELFTRPAPAAGLADLVPGEFDNWKNPASEAMSAIGYVGNKQDFTMGANWMRAAVLRNINGGN